MNLYEPRRLYMSFNPTPDGVTLRHSWITTYTLQSVPIRLGKERFKDFLQDSMEDFYGPHGIYTTFLLL
jgi:hypothetical protein